MGILEDQREIIWQAIKHWTEKRGLGTHYFSLLTAGRTKEPYPPDRIARGITDGSERISSDLVHACVEIFGLLPTRQTRQTRQKGPEVMAYIPTDEECVELLIAPLRETTEQGKFPI